MIRRLVLVGLLLSPLFAEAAPHIEPDGGPCKVAAKLYHEGKFDDALARFEVCYQLQPRPQVLYNMGQTARLAHQPEKALEYYRRFLAADPEARKHAPEIDKKIAEVQAEVDAKQANERAAERAAAERAAAENAAAERASAERLAAAERAASERSAAVRAAATETPLSPYSLGAYVRGIFAPNGLFSPFLQSATSMESASVGLSFTYHRGRHYDVVTSLDFSFIDVHDGNFLSNDHDASLDTHFLQFRNLNFLSADVSIIGHSGITRWLEIRYGAGLGIGVVLGDVLTTNDFGGCTAQNAGNLAACHPLGVNLTSAQREQMLKATESPGALDTADSPHRHVSSDTPPVMGVLNILVGFRFHVQRHLSIDIDSGFRDAIFVGAALHYRF
jgi:hypothetical protein